MNENFLDKIRDLDSSLQRLLNMTPVLPIKLPHDMPKAGIYLFSETDRPLYVGRSNNIKRRIGRHWMKGANHSTASFAFRIARAETKFNFASYRKQGSRADLMKNPDFKRTFDEAKERISKMNLRYIEETDPIRQALLEIYVALSLNTPYNDFDNH